MLIAGSGCRFTVDEAEPVQEFASVTVTVYAVVELGETEMLDATEALLHEKEVPPLAVSVALCPLQIAGAAGLIAATGFAFTTTILEAEAEQPLASVTVTE